MRQLLQDDEVQRLRERLGLRIDTAAKSVAEVLQVAADLLMAIAFRKADAGTGVDKVEASPAPEMMTPQQAADYLGVKAQTLAIWRSTGRYPIPFVKVGRKVCYRKADLDRFLQRRTEHRSCEDEPE